jgi:translation initiation factor IF-3
VVPLAQALALAEERELDLVEVSAQADPPVCRILDYGKYRFQQQKRDKDARKKSKGQVVKEMKMRPKIDLHDYNFKVRAIKDFLLSGYRVKVAVFFRGREMAFLDRGREVLDKVVRDCEGIGKVDMPPRMEGRYMRLMMMPVPQSVKKPKAVVASAAAAGETEKTKVSVEE